MSMDHPRSRGEYATNSLILFETSGSSPLSRGIQIREGCATAPLRIIPALAGNTTMSFSSPNAGRDHPRSRGEYKWVQHVTANQDGSSPLSRGIRFHQPQHMDGHGIIPALAGNTWFPKVWTSGLTDHPRSRGEYFMSDAKPAFMLGSSPLSRGIPLLPEFAEKNDRIIPALAGNTGGAGSCMAVRPDHPRSRGEYFGGRVRFRGLGGSSPLSRGIRECCNQWNRFRRIIPALAGNTP